MQSNRMTILAQGTFIRGDLFSEDILVVEGGVEGNIVGDRVMIKNSGWIHGDLSCRSLSIEPGGLVDGMVKVASQPLLSPGMAEPEKLPEGDSNLLPEAELVDKPAAAQTDPQEAPANEPDIMIDDHNKGDSSKVKDK